MSFPIELVDKVFEHLDGPSLRECGLVCKYWLHSNRSRVFASVVLSDRFGVVSRLPHFFALAQNSLVPFPNFIHSLDLTNDPTPALIANIQLLQGLRCLKICLSDKELALHLDFLSAAFPCLQELEIDGQYNTPQPILDAVQAFQSITSLRIVGTLGDDFFDKPGPAGSPTCQFPPKLHTLFIAPHDRTGTADGFFRLVLASEPIPVFSTLYAHDTWATTNSPLGRYLIRVGERLRRLCIEIGRSAVATCELTPI
jgi:hypothetical protein